MGRVAAAVVAGAVLITAGVWWFSTGAGLICAGVMVAVLGVLMFTEVKDR